jgi:hypothetical protein
MWAEYSIFIFSRMIYPDDNVMAHAQKPVLVFRLNGQILAFRQWVTFQLTIDSQCVRSSFHRMCLCWTGFVSHSCGRS